MESYLSDRQIQYTISHLMDVVGIESEYSSSRNKVYVDGIVIEFSLMSSDSVQRMLYGFEPICEVPAFDGNAQIPIFGTPNGDFSEVQGNTLIIHADILTYSFLLLSGKADMLLGKPDMNGRVSYRGSLQEKYHTIDLPIVDEYAMLLRKEILYAFPNVEIKKRKPQLIPTHDVDTAIRYGTFCRNVKTIIGGDLILRKSPRLAMRSFIEAVKVKRGIIEDPLIDACYQLEALSKKNKLQSLFFFLGYDRADKDFRYDCRNPKVAFMMRKLEEENAIIGLHGGVGTSDNERLLMKQKKRVEKAYGRDIAASRQHYLAFSPEKTPLVWKHIGIKDDYTLSYHDHEGFRCGTCHPYKLYDLTKDEELCVIEHPLIVMDGTLRGYRRLSTQDALQKVRKLYHQTERTEGDFVILWHNGSVIREWSEWYKDVYVEFFKMPRMRSE